MNSVVEQLINNVGRNKVHSNNNRNKQRDGQVFFNTQQFIALVERKPCLWKYSDELFHDKEAKTNAWKSIAYDIYPDWRECSEETKIEREKELVKKWRNIRDCFCKDMKDRQCPQNNSRRRLRRYLYANMLSFLLQNNNFAVRKRLAKIYSAASSKKQRLTANNETLRDNTPIVLSPTSIVSSNITGLRETIPPQKPLNNTPFSLTLSAKPDDSNGNRSTDATIPEATVALPAIDYHHHQKQQPPACDESGQTVSASFSSISSSSSSFLSHHSDQQRRSRGKRLFDRTKFRSVKRNRLNFDEDELFLMSLLPTLKRLDNVRKVDLKVEFLNAVRKIQHRCNESTLCTSSGTLDCYNEHNCHFIKEELPRSPR